MTPTSPTLLLTRTHIYLLAAALLAVCALYSAWRRHAVKCLVPLRGPAPSSFLLGVLSLPFPRNSPDLYSAPHGLAYHHALSATYGRAFKVRFYGPCITSICKIGIFIWKIMRSKIQEGHAIAHIEFRHAGPW
ncbi:hypothetical protein B0H10DRAFT_2206214 [Mycena sp. CBHHK59/15]|nr:hypothetical protein B0H10DRAFT_2206214 [Mycena sp. CBHHK59/15]